MSALDIFLWIIFPYVCLATLILGLIWRWRTDKFGWTSRSSEIYERTWLRISSPLFHFGILFVVLGHFGGLVIPASWTEAVGVSEHMYHLVAVVMGSLAGAVAIVGLIGLLIRRFKYKSVRFATSRGDIVMYIFLLIPIALGASATVLTQIFGDPGGYNYRETISPWFRSLFYFQPDVALMVDVPLVFKLHIIAGFLLFAMLPFTRLVHAVAPPVLYPARPYMVYRSRATTVGRPPVARGWEPIPTTSEQVRKRKRTGHKVEHMQKVSDR
ncbi:respiratory nitrate reductase subunit gamma [Actinomyces sp. F1_1611]